MKRAIRIGIVADYDPKNQSHSAIDQNVLHKTRERRRFIKLQENNSDGVERKICQEESLTRNALEKISNFFRAVLSEAFEPDFRVDKIHGQSPRHSSAFRCNCNDVNFSPDLFSAPPHYSSLF